MKPLLSRTLKYLQDLQLHARLSANERADNIDLCQQIRRELDHKETGARREFNSVGHPELPAKPDLKEIARWLRDKAIWEELQYGGREMDARKWAATCLVTAAEDLERTHPSAEPK